MRSILMVAVVVCLVPGVVSGCEPRMEVATLIAPDPGLTAMRTFRVLPTPARRERRSIAATFDPMAPRSIANRALQDRVIAALEDHGYALGAQDADFYVAVYASVDEELDISQWNFGYPYWPKWRWRNRSARTTTAYPPGTVIVDVIQPNSRELLWRGQTIATVHGDSEESTRQLERAVDVIIGAFPRATRQVARVY